MKLKKAYLVDPIYCRRPPLIMFFYDLFSLIRVTISFVLFFVLHPFTKKSFWWLRYLYSSFMNTYIFHRQNRPIGRLSRWPEDKVALEVYQQVILGCGLSGPILTRDELEEKIESTWREVEEFRRSILKGVSKVKTLLFFKRGVL